MMPKSDPFETRAAALRREFDSLFAEAQHEVAVEREGFLCLSVAQQQYAVRLAEVERVLSGKKVALMRATNPALLGVAGVRSTIVPVFDLRVLLGVERSGTSAKWMLLLRSTTGAVGIVFDRFDGYVQAPASGTDDPARGEQGAASASTVLRLESAEIPVLDLQAMIEALTVKHGAAGVGLAEDARAAMRR